MKTTRSRKPKWPKHITLGNVTVTIYRRITPNGKTGFMLAYKQDGKRKFDSYPDEAEAVQEANTKARQLSTLGVKAAQLTDDELRACVAAMDAVKPLNLPLGRAVEKLLEAVEIVGDVAKVIEACRLYASRNKRTTRKPVADVVAELLAIKESRGASARYMQDLRNRLKQFADAFCKDACNVSTADIQAWFDSRKFSAQNYMGFRRVIHLLFEFAKARGYAADNPAASLERVKVKHGATLIFKPEEIAKLLTASSPDFLPVLVIGAFAGLRSAEIERLEWSDIHFADKCIVVGADKAKTASRRVVPVADNLAAWLAPYEGRKGKVWTGGHDEFYDAQQETAKAAGLKWKANALRHSAASYMFALSNDAGRVAGFLGNSASVVHKHYRELVKPADAQRWFSLKPKTQVNVVTMASEAAN
jgi:integrase